MYTTFIHFLEQHLVPCPIRRWLHVDCPGCGLQRSLLALFQGHFVQSLRFHPAAIPMLLLFLLLLFHLKFRIPYGQKLIIALQLTVAFVTLGFYVYKIINRQII